MAPIFTGRAFGFGRVDAVVASTGLSATLSRFFFGDGVDGNLTITSGTTNISTTPTPVAPGGASSSLRISSLTPTTITTSSPNANKFAVNDKILIYQYHTQSPAAPLSGNYSLHYISSIPSPTTLTIGSDFNSVVPGSGTITTSNYDVGTSPSSIRCYVVRIAQYDVVSMPGGTLTASASSPDDYCGVIAMAAKTSMTIAGSITATGLGYPGGLGAPAGGSPASPNTGGFGDSWSGPFVFAGPAVTPGSNVPNANLGGGSGGNHNPGARSGGGGGGSAYNTGFAGGQDNPGASGPAGSQLPAPLQDVPAQSRLFAGSGGGGGADTNGIPGGAGGGVILLFSPSITITGSVVANGAKSPQDSGAGTDTGGGGAGGTILIRSQSVNIGSNLVTARGGDQGGTYTPAGWGGAGGGGLVAVYAPSITGSVTNSPVGTNTQNPVYYSSTFAI